MGNNFQLAKSRICELLVLISRTAITSGADAQTMLMLTHDYIQIIPRIANMDELAKAILKANGITPRKTPLKVRCPW